MSLHSSAKHHLIDFLIDNGVTIPPLRLIDVGVSGGIYPTWRRWGSALAGLGIDVIVDEVERLSMAETNPQMRYVAARLSSPAADLVPLRTDYSLHRSQAYLATVVLQRDVNARASSFRKLWSETVSRRDAPIEANYSNVRDPSADPFHSYYQRRFAGTAQPRITERTATLDELASDSDDLTAVDILKIDTDGYELGVLRGAESVLSRCLVVEVEVQFHGPISSDANVFCNVDLLLREHGFSLCKLETARYARSALPRGFVYDIPAQNHEGQLAWGDALYARDVADTQYASRHGFAANSDQRRNLALMLDLYGLEDMAAELLLATPGLFDGEEDRAALDFLAQKVHGVGVTYEQLTSGFLRDPLHYPAEPDHVESAKGKSG